MVEDAEAEHDTVVAEQLEEALLSGLQQQAAAGTIPPGDLAAIMSMVRHDRADLAAAVEKVQRQAQERQAEAAGPTDPEAMPGIAAPGAGAESMVAAAAQNPAEGMRAMLAGAFGAPQG